MELPDEIWLEILKRLDGATLHEEAPLVSRRFYSLTKASKLYWAQDLNEKHGKCYFSANNDCYFQSYKRCLNSKKELQIRKRFLKEQCCLKSLTLDTNVHLWGVPKLVLKKDKELVEAIVSQKYLAVLDIKNVKFTSMMDFLMLRHFKYPEGRQNFSAPWTDEELKRLLKSNKQLKVLGLPRLSPSTLNVLLKDPDLDEWRKTLKSLNIGGLKQNWIWPEPVINWRNLTDFQSLTSFTAGRMNKQFWAALPSLANLKELKLDISRDSFVQIEALDETTMHSPVSKLVLYCNESVEWIHVSPKSRLRLLSSFPKVLFLL